jgi:SAM-dependent methyltransferase
MQKFAPLAWHLPRPGKSRGLNSGFPLHLEKKFNSLVGLAKDAITLHVFSGLSSYGSIRVDVKPEVSPDVIADAHKLPIRDDSIDAILADPPYDDQRSAAVYNTGKLNRKRFISEFIRVLKPGGVFAIYYPYPVFRPKGCKYLGVVAVIHRFGGRPRVLTFYRKKINWREDELED